ncbi:YopX family protein [Listeria goaensis]|uniref:YopX family protein n=1 Tax=Listeria goaensis TaxID=1649188 RepID=UPI000B58F6F6|nr:YopX family protein [Listeria goaensis]
MREIEFRVWHDKSGTLQTVKELTFDDGGHLGYLESRDEHGKAHGFYPCIDSIELMQYTGLHDKNGKKIFEGDIGWDDYSECWGVVIFDEGKFIYEWKNVAEDLWEVTDDIEIRGNKWQNPELLESKR